MLVAHTLAHVRFAKAIKTEGESRPTSRNRVCADREAADADRCARPLQMPAGQRAARNPITPAQCYRFGSDFRPDQLGNRCILSAHYLIPKFAPLPGLEHRRTSASDTSLRTRRSAMSTTRPARTGADRGIARRPPAPSIMRCWAIWPTAPTHRCACASCWRPIRISLFGHTAQGLLLHAGLQPRQRAGRPRGAGGRAPAARRTRHAASRRTSRRSRIGSRATSTPRWQTWEQILDEHPLDVLAFRLHHFLAFWYGRPEVMARAGRCRVRALERPSLPAGPRCSPAAALPTRRSATTPSPRPRAARPSRWRPATCGPRTASPMSWRCRGGTTKASPGWTASSPTGRAATTSCTICGGTAGCTISSGASSPRCCPSTTAVSAISPRRSPRPSPTSTSTSRMPPPCCSGWSARASTSATDGTSWPTRPRRASAIACPRSRCRTG